MKELTEQHDQAMALADDADLAAKRGDEADALRLYRAAFELERKAATTCADSYELEPTRSILHRSAASLALQTKEYRECERLVCCALAGNPPAEIADELRELWERASFSMHLDAKGFQLDDNHLLVSMWGGRYVGFGFASCAEVVERLDSTQKMLYRTVERLTKQPYREQGDVPKTIRENFHVWASVPKAASYAFVLRIGSRDSQSSLFDGHQSRKVINEVMDCIDLVGKHHYAEIEKRMGEKAYYRNFIGLTRQIAPRGRDVTSVGFACVAEKESRQIIVTPPRLRRPRASPLFGGKFPSEREPIKVSGRLLYADSRSESRNQIEVEDDLGITHKFIVPRGLMADVVRPHYEKMVTIYGVRRHTVLQLESIVPFREMV